MLADVSARYPKSPLTEAIIDLRVSLAEGSSVDRILGLYDHIRDRFPQVEPMHSNSVTVEAGPTTNLKIDTSQQHRGFQFRSADQRHVFQASLDGIVVNRLAPYESWESLRDETRELWGIYTEVVQPTAVTRAEVRYINRLDLPGPNVDFNDYLLTVPEIGRTLLQGISGFFMQLQCPQPDISAMLIINEALVPSMTPDIVPVILGFDLFREQIWAVDDDGLWSFLEQLRQRKNQAFEGSITDATRRLFE